MNQDEILNLIRMLPTWAQEDTLKGIVNQEGSDLQKNITAVNSIARKLGLKEVTVNVHDAISGTKKMNKTFERTLNNISKGMNDVSAVRSTNGIEALGEIADITGSVLGQAGGGVSALSKFFGRRAAIAGKITGTVAKTAGGFLKAFGGLTAAIAPLIYNQEKNIRASLDFGLVFDNSIGNSPLAGVTALRGSTANMGMGMGEMLKGGELYRTSLVNLEGPMTGNVISMNNFMSTLAKNSREDAGFNQMGLIATEFQASMGQQANLLFQLGEMTKFNIPARKRMVELFNTTQSISLGLADMTGINRQQLLDNALSAEATESVRSSLLRQKDIIEGKYGEHAVEQIAVNADMIGSLFKNMVPALAPAIETTIMNATSMLGTTDNINAAITPELQEILALMNNGTSNKLLALLQDGLTSKIDRQELVNRARDMLQDMQKLEYVPATANADPTMKAYNRVINESLMVSDAFINSTDDIVAAKIEGAAAKVEQGDDSVEGMEGVKVGLRNLQHNITPGFESLSELFADMANGLGDFRDFLIEKEIFGFKADDKKIADKLAPEIAKDVREKFDPYRTRYTMDPSTFDPNITLDDDDPNVKQDRYIPQLHVDPKSRTAAPSTEITKEQAEERLEGGRVSQHQIGQNKFRSQPLADALLTVLENAAIVTDPNIQVVVTSGGQMPLEEWMTTPGRSQRGDEYFVDGKKARKGSRRHDGGNAADFKLKKDGKFLGIKSPEFLSFVEAAFALGAKAGSAAHGYMGSETAHIDIVGTSLGGGITWANADAGFRQAQDRGLIMQQHNADDNLYQKRLKELRAVAEGEVTPTTSEVEVDTNNVVPAVEGDGNNTETKTETIKTNDKKHPLSKEHLHAKTEAENNNVIPLYPDGSPFDGNTTTSESTVPDDGMNARIEEIQALKKAEEERINRSLSGENEYWGKESGGRRKSNRKIQQLLKEMEEITREMSRDQIMEAQ